MKFYVVMLLFLFGLGNTVSAQQSPNVTFEPYTFKAQNGQNVEAELGTLTVPEIRKKDNGKTLKLKFVRFKSTNPKPGSPIVYLAGGPGGSGIGTARGSRFELFMAMREIGDVIAFDQRGTGISDKPIPFEEYWTYPLDQPLEQEKAYQIISDFTKKARQFWEENGVDLAAYNTNESADDLNDLRLALGAKKISLWSISYGSHLALVTMKRHEDHLDRVILAGVEGLDDTVKLPSDTQRLLEKIDELIKSDAKAKQAYPNFLADLESLLQRVAESPVMVKTTHPVTKQEIEIATGKLELQILFSWSLRGPSLFSRLPFQVKQMLNGNFSHITNWLAYTHGGDISAMSTAMDVASGISLERKARIAKEAKSTLLSDAINFGYMAHHEALKDLDLGEDFRKPVISKLPVLCISGTLDGRTAPGNAINVLHTLPNGHHLLH